MSAPTTPGAHPGEVTTAQIAQLTAWARRLAQAGRHAETADRAAYQKAKTALLARITHHPDQASTKDIRD